MTSITGINSHRCDNPKCFEENATKKCSGCHKAFYCGALCQKIDWPAHKQVCKVLKTSSDPAVRISQQILQIASKNPLEKYIFDTYIVAFKGQQVGNIADAAEILIGVDHSSTENEVMNMSEMSKMMGKGDIFALEGLKRMIKYPGQSDTQTYTIYGWDYTEQGDINEKPPEFWKFVEEDSWIMNTGSENDIQRLLKHPNRQIYYKQAEDLWNKRQESLIQTLKDTETLRNKKSGCKTILMAGFDHLFPHPYRPFTHESILAIRKFLNSRNALILVPKRYEALLKGYVSQETANQADEKGTAKQFS